MNALNIARMGLMAASRRFEVSAVKTARMNEDPDVDVSEEAVEQISAKQQFSANLGVIRVSNDMWRSLLQMQEDAERDR